MAVKPIALDNPERDLALDNRGVTLPADPPTTLRAREHPAAVELRELKGRIEDARKLRPAKPEPHCCGSCWGGGRDAAIRAIEGE